MAGENATAARGSALVSGHYKLTGTNAFNLDLFKKNYIETFGKDKRFNSDALNGAVELLGKINADAQIVDVRWVAYMLATVCWETTSLKRIEVPKRSGGKPVTGKNGRPVMVSQKQWQWTMAPAHEVGFGKGRRYAAAVKVKRSSTGGAIVTEQDGDQWSVTAAGAIKALTKHVKLGTVAGAAAVKTYEDDDGTEQVYYGRGYVQLTWWSNYVKAGVAIGKGLDLLFDPEKVNEPEIAYKIMSGGMRTGSGFANHRTFSRYFNDKGTDYKSARRMVNGHDKADEIAAVAERFEKVLQSSRGGVSGGKPLT
jgi:hypothetical protein